MHRRIRLPLLFFIAFYLLLIAVLSTYGWTSTWQLLSVHTMSPPLADMRTVQGALISLQDGFDPFIQNPGDPWGRELNYPPVWVEIARFLSLQDETNYRAFIVAYEAVFLCCVAFLLFRYTSWLLALAAISGATLMGIERGNNELLIFALIVVALSVSSKIVRGLMILVAAVLKLYPIIASISLLEGSCERVLRCRNGKRGPDHGVLVLIALVVVFLAYVALDFERLMRGIAVTPAGGSMTYGIGVLEFLANERFPFLGINRYIIGAFFLLVFLLAAFFAKRIAAIVQCPPLESGKRVQFVNTAFLVGASIYVTTFAVGKSWDYRMIFCMLCVPFMLSLGGKPIRYGFGAALLIGMNQFMLVGALGFVGGVVTVFGKIVLVVILMLTLIARAADMLLPDGSAISPQSTVP